jgi:hypothetical protein
MMWWQSLSLFEQISFITAVSATFVMLVFLVLMLIGVDGSDFDGIDVPEIDTDFLNDEPISAIGGLRIFTIKGALAFLSIGGWIAYIFAGLLGPLLSVLLGAIFGSVAAVLQAMAFKAMMKLEVAGNLDYKNAIGKTGTVYMRVPKDKSGKGKITVVIQERYAEIDAITEDLEDILPKSTIEIIGLYDETTLLVKRK